MYEESAILNSFTNFGHFFKVHLDALLRMILHYLEGPDEDTSRIRVGNTDSFTTSGTIEFCQFCKAEAQEWRRF